MVSTLGGEPHRDVRITETSDRKGGLPTGLLTARMFVGTAKARPEVQRIRSFRKATRGDPGLAASLTVTPASLAERRVHLAIALGSGLSVASAR